ncbi:MAG TPA: LysM peptidoglycan-binding domain-containing protein [Mucilaginibacter sp.]|nr:LysM peptidoglycan-binding domain-containing protein [Mucilaginibacter sp.]
MKRISTLIFCLLLLQIVKAASYSESLSTDLSLKTTSPVKNHYDFNPADQQDTVILPIVNQPAPLNGEYNIFKKRLDSIKKDVPLDYNEYVQSYIEIYAHNREEMGRVLGLTKYYFPIYEKAFKDAGIPDELKYLSIVESKLDPYAVSRVGATGPWQFMFTTARLYGLNMDDYVDDRRDPIQATYAAAAYLKDAYEEFGDWLLAIASYNCGKSNVEHAIDKAGASDFWSIRPYLPVETRGYVPAFIAVTYLMNYYSQHNIVPQACNFALKTDTVLVNKYVSLGSVAQVLNVDISVLTMLNPAYKRQIINGTATLPRRLIIPQVDKSKFGALYDALNNSSINATAPVAMHVAYVEHKTENRPLYHKVRRGETLTDIADNYGIEVQDLKAWNHLHGNKAVVGQKLKLKETGDEPDNEATPKHSHNYITYKVKRGDTLSGIASKFDGASVEKIRALNGLKKGQLQPGMTIKISKG